MAGEPAACLAFISPACFHFSFRYEREFPGEIEPPAARGGAFGQPRRVLGQSFLGMLEAEASPREAWGAWFSPHTWGTWLGGLAWEPAAVGSSWAWDGRAVRASS